MKTLSKYTRIGSLGALNLLLASALATSALAQSLGPLVTAPLEGQDQTQQAPPSLRLTAELAQAPLHTLRSAAEGARDQVEAMAAWNAAGRRPTKIGFVRPLPDPMAVRLNPAEPGSATAAPFAGGLVAAAASGGLAWGTHVKVQGAYRLRLHLTDVQLPEGTRMWVHGAGETPREFGLELRDPAGDLWTPSVGGESLFFEIHVPPPPAAAGAEAGVGVTSFAIGEIGELFRLDPNAVLGAAPATAASTPMTPAARPAQSPIFQPQADEQVCLLDSTCEGNADLPMLTTYRRGVAALLFHEPQGFFLCSGSLLNNTRADSTPYLLTANHCFSDQTAATSLEAFWDYFTTACDGNFKDGNYPDINSKPRSNGSTLLATQSAPASDFTFVRLNSVPSGRIFLGWNANASAVTPGTNLYRLSHPAPNGIPLPQAYTQASAIDAIGETCSGLPQSFFIYSQITKAATAGGSSGSPVMLHSGQVVGQLNGICGTDINNSCDTVNNNNVDGAFSQTFASISQFLAPASPGPCVAGLTNVCLSGGRFSVSATFLSSTGQSGNAQAHLLTDDTGYLTFFSATNVEVVVKVLNGCSLTNHFWVFAGGLTNVQVLITVTDSQTGLFKTYANPLNTVFAPIQDTGALPCP